MPELERDGDIYWRGDGFGIRLKSPRLVGQHHSLRAIAEILHQGDNGDATILHSAETWPLDAADAAGFLQAIDPQGGLYKDFLWVANATRDYLMDPASHSQNGVDPPKSPWDERKSLARFLSETIEMPEGLVSDIVFPGCVTFIAAPSGTGKSVCTQILAYELARGGVYRGEKLDPARVFYVDTDNPAAITQRRLKRICAETDIQMEIITRDFAPPLTDAEKWADLPAEAFDVVIIDSFGGATPGVSEKEGKQLQNVMHVLTSLADRGPAVVVLENTGKNAASYRGRGEKVERVELFFEVRDVTDWIPQSREFWWESIPSGDDAEWASRASRRANQEKTRLAFVCRKGRIGVEPSPFVIEIDFTTKPWTLTDVTDEIEAAGENASKEAQFEKQWQLQSAARNLANEVLRRSQADDLMSKGDAEEFLQGEGLKRNEARKLLNAYDVAIFPTEGLWKIGKAEGWGSKKAIFPPDLAGVNGNFGGEKIEKNQSTKSNTYEGIFPPSAHHADGGKIDDFESTKSNTYGGHLFAAEKSNTSGEKKKNDSAYLAEGGIWRCPTCHSACHKGSDDVYACRKCDGK